MELLCTRVAYNQANRAFKKATEEGRHEDAAEHARKMEASKVRNDRLHLMASPHAFVGAHASSSSGADAQERRQ